MTNNKTMKERFLKYVSIHTTSNPHSTSSPSFKGELDLIDLLEKQVKELGLKNIHKSKYGFLYALLPKNSEGFDTIGLIAHVDTSSEASGKNIKTITHKPYNGLDIVLNENTTLSTKDFPFLKKWKGREVITTDGNSLLGADDKSGITEIMETIVYLIDNPDLKHGDIYIGFTPDEEIGRGTDNFELDKFKCDYAYTIDGGLEGEINYENFNAASANVTFLGQNIHPGTAKDKMVNSMKIAMEFDSHLNQNMVPEKTDKYQGFNHLTDIKGDVTNTHLHYIIRNHDMDLFKKQKNDFLEIEKLINKKYGANRCKVDIKDSYFNMHEYLKDNMFIVEKIINATKSAGVDTIVKPIRGGTDGALLTYKGLMTPNVGTGGANFHGNLECISIEGMMLVKSILINLLTTK